MFHRKYAGIGELIVAKETTTNIDHHIQLKQIEIANYQNAIKNYPPDRMLRHGKPHLAKLQNELVSLQLLKSQFEVAAN